MERNQMFRSSSQIRARVGLGVAKTTGAHALFLQVPRGKTPPWRPPSRCSAGTRTSRGLRCRYLRRPAAAPTAVVWAAAAPTAAAPHTNGRSSCNFLFFSSVYLLHFLFLQVSLSASAHSGGLLGSGGGGSGDCDGGGREGGGGAGGEDGGLGEKGLGGGGNGEGGGGDGDGDGGGGGSDGDGGGDGGNSGGDSGGGKEQIPQVS